MKKKNYVDCQFHIDYLIEKLENDLDDHKDQRRRPAKTIKSAIQDLLKVKGQLGSISE